MADSKILDLTEITSFDGTEAVALADSASTNKRISLANMGGTANARVFTVGPGGKYSTLAAAAAAAEFSTLVDAGGIVQPELSFGGNKTKDEFTVTRTTGDKLGGVTGKWMALVENGTNRPALPVRMTSAVAMRLLYPNHETGVAVDFDLYFMRPAIIFLMPGYEELLTSTVKIRSPFISIVAYQNTTQIVLDGGSSLSAMLDFSFDLTAGAVDQFGCNRTVLYGLNLEGDIAGAGDIVRLPTGAEFLQTDFIIENCQFSGAGIGISASGGFGLAGNKPVGGLNIRNNAFSSDGNTQIVRIGQARELIVEDNICTAFFSSAFRFIGFGVQPANTPVFTDYLYESYNIKGNVIRVDNGGSLGGSSILGTTGTTNSGAQVVVSGNHLIASNAVGAASYFVSIGSEATSETNTPTFTIINNTATEVSIVDFKGIEKITAAASYDVYVKNNFMTDGTAMPLTGVITTLP